MIIKAEVGGGTNYALGALRWSAPQLFHCVRMALQNKYELLSKASWSGFTVVKSTLSGCVIVVSSLYDIGINAQPRSILLLIRQLV